MNKKAESNAAITSGRLLSLIGFGGWLVAMVVLSSMDTGQLLKYTFESFSGGAPIWFTLCTYAKGYGIFVGIAGVVLWIVGYSIKTNKK